LITRLKNELHECSRTFKHTITVSDIKFEKFPVNILLNLVDSPGPYMNEGVVETKFTHSLKIIITEEYPYQTPIVRWQSTIFHPNIMDPMDGGYVCTKLLREWSFSSNLVSFIKGLESLLANPNPDNPYVNQGCTRAAEYFNKHEYGPPKIHPQKRKSIRIVDDSEGLQ